MRPATQYDDRLTGGECHRAEAHCRRCGSVIDLHLQPDASFLCSTHEATRRALAIAEPFGPTNG